jgi:transcription elongation GreA/GreB family factor
MTQEDFQSYVASGRLTQAQVNKLLQLKPKAYCLHRSWGFGMVHSYDPVLGQILIDFAQKPQHAMQLDYAAESLTPLSEQHILTLKASNLSDLKTKAKENHAEVVKTFAESFGEAALPERLEATLVGEVVSLADWKNWINTAKKACKKDGRIAWPTKKNEPIRILEKAQTPADILIERLTKTRTLDELLTVADDVLRKAGKTRDEDLKSVIPELVKLLDEHVATNRSKNPSILIEATWIRDDLLAMVNEKAAPTNIKSLVQEVHNLHHLVSDLSAHRQKHILPVIKESFPDWEQRIQSFIPTANGKLLSEIVGFFQSEGKEQALLEIFQRALNVRRAGPEMMIWLCKNRDEPSYAKWLPNLINGQFFAAILHQLEVAALESGGRKKNPLSDLLLSDLSLVADLIGGCDAEEAKDLGKAILMNPAIEELDKRSLMARLIKVSPSVQVLLVSNTQSQAAALIVSWESLERRKNEYEEIINKKIPENSKEIAIARSYGDLRENHEFKAAKEMQTILMRQKAELEEMLARARGTDFYKPDTSMVSIGTRVTLEPLDGSENEVFTILGAWDSDPDKKIISYLAGLAAAIMGKKVGDEAALPSDHGERRIRITNIEAALLEGDAPSPSPILHEVEA